jgi:hypothetical protein
MRDFQPSRYVGIRISSRLHHLLSPKNSGLKICVSVFFLRYAKTFLVDKNVYILQNDAKYKKLLKYQNDRK